ncbi:hypothetical protein [Novosphingobium arvoryzae]|uniref:Uncharacterized protein n=1 Tax=Novosphingobium arvoryzae TaxID=1256514 RepID=A0A918R7P2_9SPHN|nr:hypothetical protein [Novosphingobium arvoryzae]GGZ87764.1 hypothetical protein GCM10011617_03150 [Novosphingobium arvoryzae]
MRLACLILPAGLLMLGGCNREPEFEQRYADVSARIGASAEAIDAALAATDSPLDTAETEASRRIRR